MSGLLNASCKLCILLHDALLFILSACQGFSEDATYALYINGLDWNKNPVELLDILQRKVELKMLLDVWLSKW